MQDNAGIRRDASSRCPVIRFEVKIGAGKRHVAAREEMQRLLQQARPISRLRESGSRMSTVVRWKDTLKTAIGNRTWGYRPVLGAAVTDMGLAREGALTFPYRGLSHSHYSGRAVSTLYGGWKPSRRKS
ncbi:hypothetical protein BN873_p20063 [Candidatus Competibacter denitrificans Run_A_D11]|uniref:Uncharacterized protein n=1 Tax=Candidatus Competibacter denitrificans Run_A_D11 TaxID=1400863 RepID=W6MEI7_9GAMM|nr:hypothetical protein BN873_p20063 [Candidatus Competibacter denitrificans Run_A_D11]